jgi:HK97 family phage portal protein
MSMTAFPAEPLMVKVLHPESVTITRTNGKLQYIVRNSDQVEGTIFGSETILHIPLIRLPGADYGLSPLDALRNTFALGLTVEEYAQRFFATGSTPTGVIEVADSSLTPDQVKAIKEGWIRHHTGANMHTPGVLVGATFKALSFRPEDAQLLGLRARRRANALIRQGGRGGSVSAAGERPASGAGG